MKNFKILSVLLVGVMLMTAMVSCKPSADEPEPNSKTADAAPSANDNPVQTNTNDPTDTPTGSNQSTTTTTKKENSKTTTTTYTINPKSQTELSDAEQKKIKQDFVVWWNKKNSSWTVTYDKVRLGGYYGTYNGAVALFIDTYESDYLAVVVTEIIADYEFVFGSSQMMHAYKEGKFLYLKEAYETGWLTKDDVGTIHAIHSNSK